MSYEIKFGPGEKVHARVISQIEMQARDQLGNLLFDRDGHKIIVLKDGAQVMEDFVFREFTGEVVSAHVDKEGDGLRVSYCCTHPDVAAKGLYWVDERWLTPA